MAQLSFGKKRRRVNYDLMREVIVWAVQIIIVCAVAFACVWYFGFKVSTIGDSMKPELQNGDITLLNRLVYDVRKPRRGEVVAFKPNGNENSHYYIKRIIGLPGETKEQMLETVTYLNHLPVQGIKMQLLHVLKETDLADDYLDGKFNVLTQEEYLDILITCLENISPEIVVHRVTGDGPKDLLIAPLWSSAKRSVLNELHHEMKLRDTWQGKQYKGGTL